MDAYMYRAALYCGACGRYLIARMGPAPAEPWDSDAYPKGPFPDGGGESDTPQHCDECGTFLQNPLTADGERYVRREVRRRETIWHEFYSYLVPSRMTARAMFRNLAPDYSANNDPWGHTMGAFFDVAAECYTRGIAKPEWHYRPGAGGANISEDNAPYLASLSNDDLSRLGDFLHRLTEVLKRAGRDY